MARYIDADKLIESLNGLSRITPSYFESFLIGAIQKSAVEIDIQPVIHARWKGKGMGDFYCSYCNEDTYSRTKYCGNCGAKMDEEVE